MTEKKVAFFGPWVGEFGWELMTWQAWCRKKAKEFEKSYVCSYVEMEPLYSDFAEFVPHTFDKRCLDWQKEEHYSKAQVDIPDDVTDQFIPPKSYRHTDGDFIKFGGPREVAGKVPILIHARGIKRGGKNYPLDQWDKLVKIIASNLTGNDPMAIASVGTHADHHIRDTTDLRALPLKDLMWYMAGAKCVVGQSSGVMHLASLCGAPHVVWGPSKVQFGGENLETRYSKTWNPLKTPCTFISHDEWKPDPGFVTQNIKAMIEGTAQPTVKVQAVERPTLPRAIRDRLLMAAKAGQYIVAIAHKSDTKIELWNIAVDFPKDDLIPAMEAIVSDVRRKNFPPAEGAEPEETGELLWR